MQQIHTAYDIQSLLNRGITGNGHTIVIIDGSASPNIVVVYSLFMSYQ